MSCLYLCLGVISLPTMALFWTSGESKIADLNELITATSLGNIGGSNVACGQGGFSFSIQRKKLNQQNAVAAIDL